jgi:hypothetical protein
MHQERPNGAGILVRQRDCRHILVASAHEFRQPAFCQVRLVLSDSDHRSGTMNQQGSQVGIPAFADAQQGGLAAAGVLLGHQAQPGGQLPAIRKSLCITDRGDERTRGDRANARNLCQLLAGFILAVPGLDLAFQFKHLAIQFLEVIAQAFEQLAIREARAAETGKKPTGKPPQEGQCWSDQINLTDEESSIMKVAGGGFEQCYNAQAAVAGESMLAVATGVTQAGNDKQQVEPTLTVIATLPATLGRIDKLLVDAGYCSEHNIAACEAADIEPFMAVAREKHHAGLRERFTEPAPLDADAPPLKKKAHKLKTRAAPSIRPKCVKFTENPSNKAKLKPIFNVPPNNPLINIMLDQSNFPSVTTRGIFGG